jgi:hypothetical protein
MAKRLTIQEKEVRKLITERLRALGKKIRVTTARSSKVSKFNKRHLRDSVKSVVDPYDTLVITQYVYGKYNTPKGQPTPKDRSNIENTPLRNAIAEFVDEETKIFVKDMVDLLKSPITKRT